MWHISLHNAYAAPNSLGPEADGKYQESLFSEQRIYFVSLDTIIRIYKWKESHCYLANLAIQHKHFSL